jgi:hypothetical protein
MPTALQSGSTKAKPKTPVWMRTHASPCDVDAHLPGMAYKIFSHAAKISSAKDPVTGRWKPGKFWASQKELADGRYGVDESTVNLAVASLVAEGWFELVERGKSGQTNIYQLFDHEDWAKKHPNRCLTQETFAWSGRGDPLGIALYRCSAGRVTFNEFNIRNLRKLGLEEQVLVAAFEDYLRGGGANRKPRNVPSGFYIHLQASLASETPLARLSGEASVAGLIF